ncbi:hypothetical protein ABK040_005536 [Willaertia magna]
MEIFRVRTTRNRKKKEENILQKVTFIESTIKFIKNCFKSILIVTTSNEIYLSREQFNIYTLGIQTNVKINPFKKIADSYQYGNIVKFEICYSFIVFINDNNEIFKIDIPAPIEQNIDIKITKLEKPFKENIKIIRGGSGFFILVTELNSIYGYGNNKKGLLGSGVKYRDITKMDVDVKYIKDLQCGLYYSVILNENGEIYASGDNIYGQLESVIFTNNYFSMLKTTDGKLLVSGRNDFEMLGISLDKCKIEKRIGFGHCYYLDRFIELNYFTVKKKYFDVLTFDIDLFIITSDHCFNCLEKDEYYWL